MEDSTEICCCTFLFKELRCCNFAVKIVLKMDNTQENIDNQPEKVDLRKWMQEHLRKYGEFARDMGEADLLSVFLMGQAAFLASPEFQKRLVEMIDLDELDVEELVRILNESIFAETIFTNPGNDEDWEKCRLPFAAWLKHGRSTEMLMENIEEAISLTENQQGKWQLANFLRDFIKKEFENERRSPDDVKEYIDYRKAIENDNIAEWALARFKTETKPKKPKPAIEPISSDLLCVIASNDDDLVNRIGKWISDHLKGIDMARLFIALIEVNEIEPSTKVTEFMKAMKLSFPEAKFVGTRQVQKDINYLQNLLPNGKRYGKDMPEHRAVIDMIKSEVLRKITENID